MRERFHQVETLRQLGARGWLGPMGVLNRWSSDFLRVGFIAVGLRSGLLAALGSHPRTAAELAQQLGIAEQYADHLAEWLSVGVQLKVLGQHGGHYRIRSRQVRRLLRPQLAPLAAYYEELVYVDLPLLQQGPERLRSGELFEIDEADPAIVARASRLGEPFIASALLTTVEASGPVRLLEVGCGTGAQIRAAARLNPELTAVGVELQDSVAELARANIAEAGLADRVEIVTGDVRELTPNADFDLITLHQNIYYFTQRERVEVLRELSGHLRAGGELLITTLVRGSGHSSAMLSLWGALTKGTSRLPHPDELVTDLVAAGYHDAQAHALDALGLYYACTARRS